MPAEPKVKNPLDDLPKSAFNLEEWKRQYSNLDTRGAGGSLEWFYEKFDHEGFSIWSVDFKYNDELTQVFMSNNQVGGFFNRLEASRKYLFGSVGVLGKANDSVISGAVIIRGQDIVPVIDVAPDCMFLITPFYPGLFSRKHAEALVPHRYGSTDQQGSRTSTRSSTFPSPRTRRSLRAPWLGTWSSTARSGPTARTSSKPSHKGYLEGLDSYLISVV